jgi:Concanavalin A-like lectin/glucanases superfamily
VRWFVLLVLTGCGRFGFGGDTAPDDALTDHDAPIDSMPTVVRFAMNDDPRTGTITATPSNYTVSCAPCPTPSGGHIGGAYHFDGATRVAIGHTELISRAPFTVALWMRAPLGSSFMSAVSKPSSLATLDNVMSLGMASGTAFWETNAGTIATATDLRGSWHHVAATWDGTTRLLYVDGSVVGMDNVQFDDSLLDVAIGGDLDFGAPAIFFTGEIDELELHQRALGPSEIAALASQ